MSAKKSSAFMQVKSSSNPTEATATPPSSLSSSSSPDVGGGPLRIVSRSSSPSSQPMQAKPATTVAHMNPLLPPPPPLHPHQVPPPPPLAPSFSHASSMVGPSNIIIHSQNLNHFPFVSPASQYGLLASTINSAGQPQTIIVNHCGQPVGIVAPNFYPQMPGSSSVATPSSGTMTSSGSSVMSRQQPLLMACRPAPPNVMGSQSTHGSGLNLSGGSSNMPLFPTTQMFPTYAFPAYNNQSLLLPTGQILCRTPQGQLIGFQIPTNLPPQQMPIESHAAGGGKLQPVLPKPGSIFPVQGSNSRALSKSSTLNPQSQMTPLAAALCSSFAAPAPVICSSTSSSSSTVIVKHDPEAPAAPSVSLPPDPQASKSNGVINLSTSNQHALMQPSLNGADNNHTPITIPEVVDTKNELTAADIHAMFVQEVENMPAADRPQVLTHFIDGFVIQESLEPFPLSPLIFDEFPMLIQPSTGAEWASAPPQLTPEERMTPPTGLVPDTVDSVSICTHCEREMDHASRFDGEFCSKKCSNKYQRHRANSGGSSSTKESTKSKSSKHSKRQKFEDPTPNIATPSTTSSPKRNTDTPSELPSTSNSFTLEEPSPPLMSDKIPSEWTVDDVQAWLVSLGIGSDHYMKFRQQEIDGQALFLLQEDHLVKMGLKLGPLVKILNALKILKDKN